MLKVNDLKHPKAFFLFFLRNQNVRMDDNREWNAAIAV